MSSKDAVHEEIVNELEDKIKNLQAECKSLSDENRMRAKNGANLYNILVTVRDALAVDTILQKTHRERNIRMRGLVILIQNAIENDDFEGLSEAIPF